MPISKNPFQIKIGFAGSNSSFSQMRQNICKQKQCAAEEELKNIKNRQEQEVRSTSIRIH